MPARALDEASQLTWLEQQFTRAVLQLTQGALPFTGGGKVTARHKSLTPHFLKVPDYRIRWA